MSGQKRCALEIGKKARQKAKQVVFPLTLPIKNEGSIAREEPLFHLLNYRERQGHFSEPVFCKVTGISHLPHVNIENKLSPVSLL